MKLLPTLALNEAGFVFDPTTGDSFAANAVGAAILAGLRAGQPAVAIQAGLLERYEVSAAQLHRDYDDFVALLTQFRLLDLSA